MNTTELKNKVINTAAYMFGKNWENVSLSENKDKRQVYAEIGVTEDHSLMTAAKIIVEVTEDYTLLMALDYNNVEAMKVSMTLVNNVTKREVEDGFDKAKNDFSDEVALAAFLCTARAMASSDQRVDAIKEYLKALGSSDEMPEGTTMEVTSEFVPKLTSGSYEFGSIMPFNMSFLDNGFYVAEEFTGREPKIFPLQTAARIVTSESYESLKQRFNCFKDREFTEEEKAMMEANKVDEFYEPSENVIIMAKKVSESMKRPRHLRKNNILLEGPTGTGKTKDSQVFADLIGLPYTKITCFADMDSSDVAGAIYPVLENKDSGKVTIPKDQDIDLDPEGCYEMITGQKKKGVTPDEVRTVLDTKLADYYKSGEGQNSPEYVYYASEIVKAFENGWVLEIQEPTCIADAAVLMILNSALEKDGIINLPDRTVRRHPDFICIMTTNRNYNGCRPLNQALRNRFNMTRKVELPGTEDLTKRIITATGCTDTSFVRKAVEAVTKLNKKADEIGLNACVSTRNLLDFVADAMDGYSIRESVHEDLLWNITTDNDDAAELETFLEQSTRIMNATCNSAKTW